MSQQVLDDVQKLFHDFAETQTDTVFFTIYAVRGTLAIPAAGELAQASINLPWLLRRLIPLKMKDVEQVKSMGTFVQIKTDKVLFFLYGQASISMWGYLEAFIEDLLVICLNADPSLLNVEPVLKLTIKLADYEQMTSSERKQHILQRLQQDNSGKSKQGIAQYEALLNIFKLGGPVDKDVKKTLLELSNVRNVLVHRRGEVDKKFKNNCPWLGLDVGDTIAVDEAMFRNYIKAVESYATIVCKRVIDHFAGDTKVIDTILRNAQDKAVL